MMDSIIYSLEPKECLLGEVQVFSGFKIVHKDFHGRQTIHCTPFPAAHVKARMVSVWPYKHVSGSFLASNYTYMYIQVHTCRYMYIHVIICTYMFINSTYMLIYTHTHTYSSHPHHFTWANDPDLVHPLMSAGTDEWPWCSKYMCAKMTVPWWHAIVQWWKPYGTIARENPSHGGKTQLR